MNLIDLRTLTKEDKSNKSNETVTFLNSLCDDTLKMYQKQHKDWYINERFARGEHWIVFNKTLNKVQELPISNGEIRRTINKIRSQIRGVKNFIKRNQPRWEVHPDGVQDEDYEAATKKNKILQNIYRTRQFPGLLTDLIVNALKCSVGVLEGGMIKYEGKDKMDFWVNDTFEVLFDPFSPTVQDCRYIIKMKKRPVTYIKNKYNVKEVAPDNKEAGSEFKDLLLKEQFNKDGVSGSKELESAIVKEMIIKWYDENAGRNKVKIITFDDKQILNVWETKYRRYPIFIYNPEKFQGSIYSDAWIKDLISPNKSLDKTVSQVESYIQRMLGGKYLVKQGVEVSAITDKGSEFIHYKGAVAPQQQQLQPLPSAPFTYISQLERWIEEFGGTREASLGRVPSSLQSGKAIEALQAADAGVVAEPVEALELMLEEVGEFMLELIEDNVIASETIIEDKEEIKYIGNVSEETMPEKTLKVTSSKVKVSIVPEIAYSEEGKKDYLFRLADAKIIDPQTLLEYLNVSNVGDVLERMKKRQEEEYKQELTKQREAHRTDGQGPEDSADLVDQENMSMSAGQPVNPTPQALWTPEHLQLHMAFISQNQDAYQQHKDMFDEHISAEQDYK